MARVVLNQTLHGTQRNCNIMCALPPPFGKTDVCKKRQPISTTLLIIHLRFWFRPKREPEPNFQFRLQQKGTFLLDTNKFILTRSLFDARYTAQANMSSYMITCQVSLLASAGRTAFSFKFSLCLDKYLFTECKQTLYRFISSSQPSNVPLLGSGILLER